MSSPTRIREEEKSDSHHIALNLVLFLIWGVVLFVLYDSLRASPSKPTFGLPFCNSEGLNGLAVIPSSSSSTTTTTACQPCPNHGYCMEGELIACDNEAENVDDQYLKYNSICIPVVNGDNQIEAAKLAFIAQHVLYEQHKRVSINPSKNNTQVDALAMNSILKDAFSKEMVTLSKPITKHAPFERVVELMTNIINDQPSLGISIERA
eukprot:CAMPEP_0117420874 /NCGR_PEP_ID=MMETSP0758-20121206/2118_1 /TAXON_ID=63605 /ORGANISM="Percolomonas cosmopolitus, Strain AE-1 (ATCC 50343)" /LENGTH=207 /DNA_ID=CAMNT_0005202739 /DNA_START=218 /DNA_END=837 /DNA_ORIENTATION=+